MKMKMKYALTLFCLVLLSSYARAQFSWGVEGAAVFSKAKTNVSYPGADITMTASNLTGFMGGAIVDIPFGDEKLRMMPELLYNSRGVKQHASASLLGQTVGVDQKITINYIDLIANLAVALPVGDQKFIIGGGPYIGYGISGKRWTKVTPDPTSSMSPQETNADIKFGSASDQSKPLDYGINIMGGFMLFNGITVKASYAFGFANLSNNSSADYKNRYLSVGLCYFIH
jgi:hypothetical protein